MRAWVALIALATGSYASPATAARPRIVTVQVQDVTGKPIPNAWVRVRGTEGRRRVDADTGLWEASTLYKNDGSPLIFVRGMALQLTITAPGYESKELEHVVRGGKNLLPIVLEAMPDRPLVPDGLQEANDMMERWLETPPAER